MIDPTILGCILAIGLVILSLIAVKIEYLIYLQKNKPHKKVAHNNDNTQ